MANLSCLIVFYFFYKKKNSVTLCIPLNVSILRDVSTLTLYTKLNAQTLNLNYEINTIYFIWKEDLSFPFKLEQKPN
jgi:hypothetical protein